MAQSASPFFESELNTSEEGGASMCPSLTTPPRSLRYSMILRAWPRSLSASLMKNFVNPGSATLSRSK